MENVKILTPSYTEVLAETNRIARFLRNAGARVVRAKVDACPRPEIWIAAPLPEHLHEEARGMGWSNRPEGRAMFCSFRGVDVRWIEVVEGRIAA
jgi:hypothetical protein